ncbi:MAG: DUF6446 family protein, partial [Pseudomonadota bacterium]
MNGRAVGLVLLGAAALAGGGLYYLEQFHWYDVSEAGDGEIGLTRADGSIAALPVTDLSLAEGASSPLKYRACFLVGETELTGLAPYPEAAPTVAPVSFPCFDADAVAAALANGTAVALLGQANVTYGIDRVVALTEDGRGFAWHQINACGEK